MSGPSTFFSEPQGFYVKMTLFVSGLLMFVQDPYFFQDPKAGGTKAAKRAQWFNQGYVKPGSSVPQVFLPWATQAVVSQYGARHSCLGPDSSNSVGAIWRECSCLGLG